MADRAEQWRQAALAFERRAMRVELALGLLVAGGHITQEKADESLALAGKHIPAGVPPGLTDKWRGCNCADQRDCTGACFPKASPAGVQERVTSPSGKGSNDGN